MSNIDFAVVRLCTTYRANPRALVTAIKALVEGEIEKAGQATEKDIALRTCRKLHGAGSDHAICLSCFDAVVEKLEGPGPQGDEDETA
jgi:hypothetical protein